MSSVRSVEHVVALRYVLVFAKSALAANIY